MLERLKKCELELQAARGYIRALEYGLHAVVAAHPAPAALAELWPHVLPEVADVHGAGAASAPIFDAAFRQALAGLSNHVDGAARRSTGDEPA